MGACGRERERNRDEWCVIKTVVMGVNFKKGGR